MKAKLLVNKGEMHYIAVMLVLPEAECRINKAA